MTADAVGGVWTYTMELARALAPRGVEVVVATMGPRPNDAQRAEAAASGNVTLVESDYRLEWMDAPWGDVARAGRWLLALEREVAPDVVHLNGYVHGALAWRAPVLVVGHSCVVSWWRAVKGGQPPAEWAPYRTAVARGLRRASAVVAPSRPMLDSLRADYGRLPAARVIHNARDAARYRPADAKEPLVLAVGRLWDEAKNIGALARVAPRLSWPVAIAGATESPDGAAQRFEHVRQLGRLDPDALAGWLARAAIYAFPARYEPFGLSVLEAALSGCALVLGDVPSLRELWGDAAVFVSSDDDGELVAAIESLVRDEAGRRALAARARARALARYTPERMADEYLDTYHELLAGGSRSTEVVACAS